MKLAIIGSRNITNINIEKYVPIGVTEIISGGARGVDTIAKEYALTHDIKYTEFVPNYAKYKKYAPLKRNYEIAQYCDSALVFWDGISNGTKYAIRCFEQLNKSIKIYLISNEISK